jgi:hypothetical protein
MQTKEPIKLTQEQVKKALTGMLSTILMSCINDKKTTLKLDVWNQEVLQSINKN